MRRFDDTSKHKLSFRNLKRLYLYFKDSKKILIGIFIFTIIRSIVGIVTPLLSANIVLHLTDGLWKELLITAGILTIINIISSSFNLVEDELSNKLDLSVDVAIQTNIAKEILELEVSELDTKSTGLFVERLNNDARGLSSSFMLLMYYISFHI